MTKPKTFARTISRLSPLILSLLVSGLTSFSASARLDSDDASAREIGLKGMDVLELQNLVREEQKTCPKLNCEESRLYVRDLMAFESKELGTEKRALLRAKTREQALGMWPDTVLEGPYQVQFRMRVDQLQELSLDGAPIGYRVMFSDKSWNTERCVASAPPTSERSSAPWYKTCETGRIYDAVFVLHSLQTAFRDEAAPATFYFDGDIRIPIGSPIQTDFSLNPNKKHILSGFSRLNLPIESGRCDKQTLQQTLVQNISLIADLIYDERGLRVCDEQESGNGCYEESALATLLTSLAPTRGGLETDLGYRICEGNPECGVQFRVQCNGLDLSLELQ